MVNDYTPTTEEVRRSWGEYKCFTPCEECPKEFDRWLAQIKADAWNEGFNQASNNSWTVDLTDRNKNSK